MMTTRRLVRAGLCITILGSSAVVMGPARPAGAVPPAPVAPVVRQAVTVAATSTSVGDLVPLGGDARDDVVTILKASGDDVTVTSRIAGAGTLAFGPAITNHVGTCPLGDRAFGDVDGDAKTDLVLGCGAGGVLTLLGNGDGSFDAPITSAAAAGAARVAIGDFTGDADLDVAVAGVTTLALLAGDGSGSFTASGAATTTTAGTVSALAAGDLDGIAKQDLVVSEATSTGIFTGTGAVALHRSDGAGGLLPPTSHAITYVPGKPVVVDLDGDGATDVVIGVNPITTTTDYGTYVLWGTGGGAVADPVAVTTSLQSLTPVVADLDGDGRLDLAMGDPSENRIVVRFGSATGLGPERGYYTLAKERALFASDLDLDGDLDLATYTTDTAGLGPRWVVLGNLGEQELSGLPKQAGGYSATEPMAVGDLTGDGFPDLAVGTPSTSSVRVFPNDGHGNLLPFVASASFLNYQGIALGHLDADADLDAVSTYKDTVHVLVGNGDATFDAPLATTTGLASSYDPLVADLDEGARDELLLADLSGSRLLLYRTDAAGNLGTPTTIATGGAFGRPAAADLDGDGHLDLVVASSAASSIGVLLGNGDGTFAAITTRSVPAGARAFSLGDVDGDDAPDVVLHTYVAGAKAMTTYLGNGDGTLGAGTTVGIDQLLDTFQLADVNSDGRLDVPLSTRRYLLGNGDGTWVPYAEDVGSTNVGTVDQPRAADLDLDGRTDLVGPRADDLMVELNRTGGTPVAAAWAPFASWGEVVDQFWDDLYDLTPTSAQRAAEITALSTGVRAKGSEVAMIRRSSEHTSNVDPVARLYRAYFLRNADPSGFDYWVLKRRVGATLSSISNKFAASSEFKRRYGSLTNGEYVALIYQNVLGRPGEPTGVSYWTKQLDTKKKSRGQVMLNFSDSNEFKRTQVAEIDTAVLYLWLLRRQPTGPEFTAAVTNLEDGQTLAQLATTLLNSTEYATRIANL